MPGSTIYQTFTRTFFWLLFLPLTSLTTYGQSAEIRGTVDDETGAVLIGVSVTLANLTTEETLTAATDNTGRYVFQFVDRGRYLIEVTVRGFSRYRSTEIFVMEGDSKEQNITLAVAALEEQVVVGISRQREFLNEAPLPALLIDRQGIEETGAQTLEELLVERAGSGVYISRGFGIGFPQINGIGRNRVLVVVDGQRQIGIDDATRQGVDLDQYTTERIQRLEVIKGPDSALYGSDAMGGVINVLTRRPPESLALDVSNSVGSFGERNHGGTVQFKTPGMSGLLTGLYRNFDGYDLDDTTPGTAGFGGGENGFIDRQLSPSLFSTAFENTQLALHANYYRRESYFLGDAGTRTEEIAQERWNIAPTVGLSLGRNNRLTIRGDVSVARRFDADRRESMQQIETLGSALLSDSYNLRYGFEVRRKGLRRPGLGSQEDIAVPLGPRGTRSVTIVSGWSQHEWRVTPFTKIIMGLRGTHDSAFGGHWTPTVATVFTLSQANRLRVSYGEGYRAPDVSELFREFVNFGFFAFVGNPFLEPEHSRSMSAGWTYSSHHLRYSLDVFYHRFFDEIGFVTIDTGSPPHRFFEELIPLLDPFQSLFSNQNLGTFDARGFNSSLSLQLPHGFFADLDYTFLDRVRVGSDDSENKGRRLIGLGNVRNASFLRLGWNRRLRIGTSAHDFSAHIRGNIRGREALNVTSFFDQAADPTRVGQTEYVPDHQIWDLSLSATLAFSENVAFQPFFTIANLTDFVNKGLEYADNSAVVKATLLPGPVFREPGRSLKGGLRIKWH